MKTHSIDLQMFAEATLPAPQTEKPSLQDTLAKLGYADGPDGMVKGDAPPAPPAPDAGAQSGALPADGAPQPPEPAPVDKVSEVLAKVTAILERQQAAPPAPPTVPLPPEPELPPMPDAPEWLKTDDAWEEYYGSNPARATRDLLSYQDQVKEAQRQRQEITSRYKVEKENALKKQELSQGFYEQANRWGDKFASMEPVALQILLKDQPELLQTMPPKLAIKVAFDSVARMTAATAPTPQPPPTPAAPGAATPGQSSAGQAQQMTPQQIDALKRQAVADYLRTLADQAGKTPPVPGTGVPAVPPSQPIKGARDATRALRASLGVGGGPR